jgi:hypothetical protein
MRENYCYALAVAEERVGSAAEAGRPTFHNAALICGNVSWIASTSCRSCYRKDAAIAQQWRLLIGSYFLSECSLASAALPFISATMDGLPLRFKDGAFQRDVNVRLHGGRLQKPERVSSPDRTGPLVPQ